MLLSVALGLSAHEVRQERPLKDVSYVGSAACKGCHPDHTASWYRTFHRTMTQVATSASVLGNFDNAALTFDGVTSKFRRDGNHFIIETLDATGKPRAYDIERTVGSRRVQQYVTREKDRFIRLPLAWDVAEKRWFHLNGGFLDPDGTDFNQHRALWDANCIFCHNVKAQPGYDWETARFDSHVAELGIACEACHGPGAEHAALNRNPLRRYWLHATHAKDPSIVDPVRLAPLQRVQVCGHCHGQRLPNPPERIRSLLSMGDPFTPGEDLSLYTVPIHRDSTLAGVDLTQRFWKDGTPRLTAYEYQALLMTRDFQAGGLTCEHCHALHGGDPRGMITKEMRGPQACASCHAAIVQNAAAHAKHRPGSSGTDCYACHLPKIVYGLMDVHPTHRISIPDPSRAWTYEMPDACTLCHLDKTAAWAEASLGRSARPPPDAGFAVPETLRALLSGDVVQRAVAVRALGEGDLWTIPFFLLAMEDNYGAVRHFAVRGLRAVVERSALAHPELAAGFAGLPRFEPQADASERARVLEVYRVWWAGTDKHAIPRPDPAVPLDAQLEPVRDTVRMLREKRRAQPEIQIGE